MVIPSLHKLALDLVGCQGASCCELGVTRGGLSTPGGARPTNAPWNFNGRVCGLLGGTITKVTGGGGFASSERTEKTREGVNELKNSSSDEQTIHLVMVRCLSRQINWNERII